MASLQATTGNWSAAGAEYLKGYQACKAAGRPDAAANFWSGYTDTLQRQRAAGASDMAVLQEEAKNPKASLYARLVAYLTIGLSRFDAHDRDGAAQAYRHGLALNDSVPADAPERKALILLAHSQNRAVQGAPGPRGD